LHERSLSLSLLVSKIENLKVCWRLLVLNLYGPLGKNSEESEGKRNQVLPFESIG